jgi:hypothetical protein
MTEVVTFFAPRPGHKKWMNYLPLIKLQKATAQKFGHKHVVISDTKLKDFDVFFVTVPQSLMFAILEGQIAYLEAWSGETNLVLVDVDCLVARNLDSAFDGSFDIGMTNREHDRAPINNGAIYISAGAKEKALAFFRKSLSFCHHEWGGDQEAISKAAAPVPKNQVVIERDGTRFAFLSMLTHNVVPRLPGVRHKKHPYIVHFKGVERKEWMGLYAKRFIL